MFNLANSIILIFLIFVSIYTVSYGIWTWKHANKLGALMVIALALVVVVLPVYSIFFKE